MRVTITALIASHLRGAACGSSVRWSDYTFPLNGTTFDDGDHDFTGIHVSGGTRLALEGAEFSGGNVGFDGAEFRGGSVRFDGAKFSGGTVSFLNIKFGGGVLVFFSATFSSGTVRFDGAETSSDTVRIGGATFSTPSIWFGDAAFIGGTVSGPWGAGPPPNRWPVAVEDPT